MYIRYYIWFAAGGMYIYLDNETQIWTYISFIFNWCLYDWKTPAWDRYLFPKKMSSISNMCTNFHFFTEDTALFTHNGAETWAKTNRCGRIVSLFLLEATTKTFLPVSMTSFNPCERRHSNQKKCKKNRIVNKWGDSFFPFIFYASKTQLFLQIKYEPRVCVIFWRRRVCVWVICLLCLKYFVFCCVV